MRKTIVSIFSLLALTLGVSAQGVINYGYYHSFEDLGEWGTGKAETYNVAIRIDDASLVGKTVKSIIVPVITEASNATEYSAFLSSDLNVSGGKAVADITSEQFEPNGEWTKVTLSEPYTIREGGFYAGYTFKISKADSYDNQYPIRLMAGDNANGLYIATSRTYRKWNSLVNDLGANSPLQVEIEGDFHENACGVVKVTDTKAKNASAFTVKATIANYGTKDINNIACLYKLGNGSFEKEFEYNITLSEPLTAKYYGSTQDITFDVPAEIFTVNGIYQGVLNITKVNGTDNSEYDLKANNTVEVMNVVPFKRPVMEEFTGTWCGFCPRGWVAMRLLNEKYPNRFIAVSYHNGDAMQIHSGLQTDLYPVNVDGFPYANLDRVHGTDPYYGDGNKNMGIEDLWNARCEVETPANIEVEAILTDKNSISATATVTFIKDQENIPYRVAYMVTADGLTGTTENWIQHSYFKGETGYGPEMDQFTKGEEYQQLIYDDVLIANTEYNGIENSLPEKASDGQEVNSQYEFALEDMVSNYGDKEYLVQDKNMLNVIAVVVNPETGEILNAAKCRVKNPTGVKVIDNANRTVKSIEYFDLSGRKISEAQATGIYIKSVNYNDGTKDIRKVRK